MANYHMLSELSPEITGWTICVFVLSAVMKFIRPHVFELHLILVDEAGTRIEATIQSDFSLLYYKRIKEDQWICITTFRVSRNYNPVRATSHDYVIGFFRNTIVSDADPREPFVFREFTPFDHIFENTVRTDILVDLVGSLVEVGNLSNTSYCNDIDGFKLSFKIMDRYKQVLKCLVSGQRALDLHSDYDKLGRRKMVVALCCWRVERNSDEEKDVKIVSYGLISKVFIDPDIPEVKEIKMVLD